MILGFGSAQQLRKNMAAMAGKRMREVVRGTREPSPTARPD